METLQNNIMNIDTRIIFLSGDIDENTIGETCSQILQILEQDDKNEAERKKFNREPIRLYINSLGGSLYDMWALIDIIISSKTPIYTYCTGYAFSAAFKIFLAGHKRFISKHAKLLYHQMQCGGCGTYQDMVDDREEEDFQQEEIENFVLERTQITKKMLKDIREKKKDRIFHADEALELGIADEMI